jgi:C-terminal processing protease CtpA/Prc
MGPLVVLVGPHTFSSAEDFLIPLVHAKRATLLGETTGGSTGQPLTIPLPGGGFCRICTLQSFFPDGREFVGRGIEPDVVVHPTQKDIYDGRDPVLEEAVRRISSG